MLTRFKSISFCKGCQGLDKSNQFKLKMSSKYVSNIEVKRRHPTGFSLLGSPLINNWFYFITNQKKKNLTETLNWITFDLAFKKLADYLQSEYMLHLRPNPGLSSLPDGLKMYQGFLEYHTSMSGSKILQFSLLSILLLTFDKETLSKLFYFILGLTPEKIHTSGLQQVWK